MYNAYEVKAQYRAQVNRKIRTAGTITVSVVTTIGAGILAPATGMVTLALWPFTIALGTVHHEATKANTFYKSLAVIAGADQGVLPLEFLDSIDEEINLYSRSSEDQKAIFQKIINVVSTANKSEELCFVDNKLKLKNIKKLEQFVLERL